MLPKGLFQLQVLALVFALTLVHRVLVIQNPLYAQDKPVKAAPEAARPVITFTEDLTMYLNGRRF